MQMVRLGAAGSRPGLCAQGWAACCTATMSAPGGLAESSEAGDLARMGWMSGRARAKSRGGKASSLQGGRLPVRGGRRWTGVDHGSYEDGAEGSPALHGSQRHQTASSSWCFSSGGGGGSAQLEGSQEAIDQHQTPAPGVRPILGLRDVPSPPSFSLGLEVGQLGMQESSHFPSA